MVAGIIFYYDTNHSLKYQYATNPLLMVAVQLVQQVPEPLEVALKALLVLAVAVAAVDLFSSLLHRQPW